MASWLSGKKIPFLAFWLVSCSRCGLTLLNVSGYSLGPVRSLWEGSCGVGSQKSVVSLWQRYAERKHSRLMTGLRLTCCLISLGSHLLLAWLKSGGDYCLKAPFSVSSFPRVEHPSLGHTDYLCIKDGKEGGTNWESSIDTYTLPCIKQMAGEELLCNPGHSAWCSVMTYMDGSGEVGESLQGEGIFVFLQLIHAAVLQKRIQHCKTIILQLQKQSGRSLLLVVQGCQSCGTLFRESGIWHSQKGALCLKVM